MPDAPTSRFGRVRRIPKALKDFLPHGLSQLPTNLRPAPPPPPPPLAVPDDALPVPDMNTPADIRHSSTPPYANTAANGYGLFRSYLTVPLTDPETHVSIEDVCDSSTFAVAKPKEGNWWRGFGTKTVQNASENIFAPFLNATTFRLMRWFYAGSSMKSLGELDSLVKDVLLADDYNREDLRNFSATRESQRLDDWEDEPDNHFSTKDGWHETSVHIRVPAEGVVHDGEDTAPMFEIPAVYYRSITEIIKTTFSSALATNFHLIPFKLYLKPPQAGSELPSVATDHSAQADQNNATQTQSRSTSSSGSEPAPQDPASDPDVQRVYSELYNSDAMIEEYERVNTRRAPCEAAGTYGPQIETVIAAIMLWSDSTHLASFGSAALWPIYMFFGNQSKYLRCKPSEFAAHHLAYIPSVSPFST